MTLSTAIKMTPNTNKQTKLHPSQPSSQDILCCKHNNKKKIHNK